MPYFYLLVSCTFPIAGGSQTHNLMLHLAHTKRTCAIWAKNHGWLKPKHMTKRKERDIYITQQFVSNKVLSWISIDLHKDINTRKPTFVGLKYCSWKRAHVKSKVIVMSKYTLENQNLKKQNLTWMCNEQICTRESLSQTSN